MRNILDIHTYIYYTYTYIYRWLCVASIVLRIQPSIEREIERDKARKRKTQNDEVGEHICKKCAVSASRLRCCKGAALDDCGIRRVARKPPIPKIWFGPDSRGCSVEWEIQRVVYAVVGRWCWNIPPEISSGLLRREGLPTGGTVRTNRRSNYRGLARSWHLVPFAASPAAVTPRERDLYLLQNDYFLSPSAFVYFFPNRRVTVDDAETAVSNSHEGLHIV